VVAGPQGGYGCFSFVSLIELSITTVTHNSHFPTKPATLTMNNNKQETTIYFLNEPPVEGHPHAFIAPVFPDHHFQVKNKL
jgi:hypothetical protein